MELELKNAGSQHLKEKGRRFRTGAVIAQLILFVLIFHKKDVALHVGAGRCLLLHTCDINVVLNAMVKVNQAAILAASPRQPRHQTGKTSRLQNKLTKEKKIKKINSNNKKTRINPFFTPGELSSSSLCGVRQKACVKAVAISKLSKGEGRPISTDSLPFSQPASFPCMVLYSTMVSPVRARSSELVLVLNRVRQCATDVHHSPYYS